MSQSPQHRSMDEIGLVEKVLTPKIRAFSRFNLNQRLELCKRLRYSAYPPETIILREGHLAFSFYVILSGYVDVLKKQNDRILKLNVRKEMAHNL
jgi:signal-transduction protein with cAMP-binding, CBS, and nucleotidyltransferase domain